LAWHVNRSLNYIFVILTPRAIDWYITESILRGPKGGGDRGILGGLQNFTGLLSARGVWYLITEMHGMPPRRPRGCFQANYQQLIPKLQFSYCIMHKLHEWSKKGLGKRFGWICALNRWSVQERAQTSFCPKARQILHYLAWELCRQIAAWFLSRLTSFLLVWGVRKGGGRFWAGGPKFTRVMSSFFVGPLPHTTLIKKKEPLWFWAPQKESLLEKTYKQTMRFSDHEEASEC
jgi:hypothetical protein